MVITETETTRTVYTISELNQMVRSLLEDAFASVWVAGEISNFACPSSGHWYFTLKDAGAQIRCAMFSGRNRVTGFKPTNGTQVLAHAKISLYEARGDYQIIVDFMEEAGDGALRRAYEILKAKLAAEGLFEPAHKKSLPTLPKSVGVITSPTGAAIRDILSVLKRRFPSLPIIIYPTAVQGTQASLQIVNALQTANARKECDVLIVARGGGSLEDLWCFNEEIVARAIFASEIPIISAVGHEIDFTIADFVADVRVPTPSAAAELVSPDQTGWQQALTKLYSNLVRETLDTLKQKQHLLINLYKRLRHPGQRIQDQFQRVDEMEQRLQRAIHFRLQQKQQQLINLTRALDAISPLATLARGYAIVTAEKTGEVIYNARTVTIGEQIKARLGQGELICTIDEINT